MHFRLAEGGISDVHPLAGLKNLKILKLTGSPITDLSPLEDTYPLLEKKDFELQ